MTLIRSGERPRVTFAAADQHPDQHGKEPMMSEPGKSPLRVYTVNMGRNVTTMQLNDAGVEEYEALGYTVEPIETAAEKVAREKVERAAQAPPRDKSRRGPK